MEWLIAYVPSCSKINFKECIDKLAEISKQLTDQSCLTDMLAIHISNLMLRLLRIKPSDYEQYFLNIVNNSPLSISEKILLQATQEQGKWIIRPSDKVTTARQLISNSELVDHAMKTWSNRVRESAEQNTLHKEALLPSILYRFAQFNGNDYLETYATIDQMCRTEDGLAAFLKCFKKESIEPNSRFTLVRDAEKLVQYIRSSSIVKDYEWLIDILSQEEIIKQIREQPTTPKLPQ